MIYQRSHHELQPIHPAAPLTAEQYAKWVAAQLHFTAICTALAIQTGRDIDERKLIRTLKGGAK